MILLTAATKLELYPFLPPKSNAKAGTIIPLYINGVSEIDGLITGIGAGLTAANLGFALGQKKYDLVVNIGIAGSFSEGLAIGNVVTISEDCFADYGVDNRGSFETLFEMGLMSSNEFPFSNTKLINTFLKVNFPTVKGITVSTASGSEPIIANLRKRYNPDIETMEGAAVFYTCLMANVPFVCIRSISNRVEPRDTSAWNIPLAIENLHTATLDILKSL
jgi:futalosine hydrolase